MEMIEVRTALTESVSAPIAAQLCSDFLEWLDGKQHWAVAPTQSDDERGYKDLANQYVETRVHV
jgi:hypothetical protein